MLNSDGGGRENCEQVPSVVVLGVTETGGGGRWYGKTGCAEKVAFQLKPS